MTTRRVLSLVVLAALPPALSAQGTAAPTGRCQLQFASNRALTSQRLPSGQRNAFTGGNVVARCPAQNLVLRSDSLESYGDEGRIVFIGNADYSEPRLKLKARTITYFQRDERVLAVENVRATLPNGSTLRGPQVEFLRAMPGVRPQQSATAIGRPTITLIERDAQGRAQPPVDVTGTAIHMRGDSIVSAVGQVVVVRPELTATGDSLFANSGTGLLRMMRGPKITGTKGRPFTLVGETIDLLSRQRKLERVVAKNAAEANSEDLALKSDSIDLRIGQDLLQRAIAWGKSRAQATSATQFMVADSIDVRMPSQRIRELHAVRAARAEGLPDTTKIKTLEKDRLTGDTIIARFDSAATTDTSKKPRIRELIAIGNATSYQHLAPRDTSSCRPDINYVRGRVITVTFDTATVSRVDVTEQAGGIYLESKRDSLAEPTAACSAVAASAPGTGSTVSPAVTPPPGQGQAPVPARPPASPPAVAPSSTPAPGRP